MVHPPAGTEQSLNARYTSYRYFALPGLEQTSPMSYRSAFPRFVCRLCLAWLCFYALSSNAGEFLVSDDVIFRAEDGRTLTWGEVRDLTGGVRWEYRPEGRSVPEEAVELHHQGRAHGSKGEYKEAITILKQAAAAAPFWPYPVYDAAFVYLMQGDAERAERFYTRVNETAPDGFFTTEASLDTLRRERDGTVTPGTYLRFVALEFEDNDAEKRRTYSNYFRKTPCYR